MRGRGRRVRALLLVAAAVLAAGGGLLAQATDAFETLELAGVDARFDLRGTEPAPEVVVAAIDDRTFDELDLQWPFPRAVHARAVRRLSAARPAAIAYDVQFTEESDDPDGDTALIESVRAARNVVLATTEVAPDGSTSVFGGAEGLEYSRGVAANSNYVNDADGHLRRVGFELQRLETFPLAAARVAGGRPPDRPGGASAPIDYPGPPATVRRVSFVDVVRGRFDESAVRGKVVVVGATAPSLQDLHRTSTTGSGLMPGPEIQAAATATALRGFPLRVAPGLLDALIVLVLGAAAPLAALRIRIVLAGLLWVGLTAGFLLAAYALFAGEGLIVAVATPLIAAAVSLAATLLVHGITVAFERAQVRDAFARFVPEAVVDEVLRSADGVRLGGVRRTGTVMFSDLRGFTSFAETLDPEQVIASLNRYLTLMSDAILAQGGTLVAYMGDGIMAVFGAPLQQDDHADRALAAARDMLVRLEEFNAGLREENLHDGFKMGIGLNSGPVMSGNVGSEQRLEYTALGDTTNTAARLEGMTKGTPHQLYVADATRAALVRPAEDLVPVGDFEVRGRQARVALWGLPAPQPAAAAAAAPPATA